MKTLILNLTRFGDLLQTQPVVAGLRERGHRVGLACLDTFAPALALIDGLEFSRALPASTLLAQMDRDWRVALGELWMWSDDVRDEFAPGELVNLTATTGVRILSRALAVRFAEAGQPLEALVGFGVDEFGFGTTSDPWTAFLLASTNQRGCSPFNLVDQFRRVAGLPPAGGHNVLRRPADAAVRVARELLGATAEVGEGGFMALQLGASEDRRRWPVAHFARLAELAHRELGVVPVLLGAGGEVGLGERFAQQCAVPFVNLIGRTSLPELAGVLCEVRLLVTNDTGTMHLAAGLGVDVAAVFLATAQPWDTGPYREGCLCLEPDMACHPCPFGAPCPNGEACRASIAPQTVFDLCRARLCGDSWPEGCAPGARAWESRVQEHGYMGLVSLSGHEDQGRTQWIRMQREVYRRFLDGELDGTFEEGGESDSPCIKDSIARGGVVLDPASEFFSQARQTLLRSEMLLTLLHEQGNALVVTAAEPIKKKFLSTWQQVQSLWESQPLLNVLGYLWMNQSQECARDIESFLVLCRRYRSLVRFWLSLLDS